MATARPPQPGEPLWRCAEPRAFLSDNTCTDDAFLPYFERAGLVESARSMAGTSVLASNWFAPLDKTGVRMRSWASNPANLR